MFIFFGKTCAFPMPFTYFLEHSLNFLLPFLVYITGMNYYDFFIFITRFTLAILTLLYNFRNDGDISHSPSAAHNLICNLISIREVASRMISAEAFAEENINSCSEGNLSAFSDIENITKEPNFVELCMAISRTYETIEEGKKQDHGEKNNQISSSHWKLEVIEACGSKIRTPEDLVKAIDQAISNHSILCGGCKFSLQSDLSDGETFGIEGMIL